MDILFRDKTLTNKEFFLEAFLVRKTNFWIQSSAVSRTFALSKHSLGMWLSNTSRYRSAFFPDSNCLRKRQKTCSKLSDWLISKVPHSASGCSPPPPPPAACRRCHTVESTFSMTEDRFQRSQTCELPLRIRHEWYNMTTWVSKVGYNHVYSRSTVRCQRTGVYVDGPSLAWHGSFIFFTTPANLVLIF